MIAGLKKIVYTCMKDSALLTNMKVAIIGGGSGGLVAAKICLEANLEPTVFERDFQLGGLWKHGSRGRVWSSLKTNLSKHTCCFSDFRWPDDAPVFPSAAQVRQYMEDYATFFDLRRFVRFGHAVTRVSRSTTGAWDVEFTTRLTSGGEDAQDNRRVETFDKCIVACGIFMEPYFPSPSKVQGIVDAVQAGWATHGATYRGPSTYAGKTVLVVGCAFSGAEIASELAGTVSRCLAATGRPSIFVPRLVPKNGKCEARPDDTRHDVPLKTKGDDETIGVVELASRLVPLDIAVYSRKDRATSKANSASPKEKSRAARQFFIELSGRDPGEVHDALRLDSDDDNEMQLHLVISDDFLNKVRDGSVEVRPRLVAVDAREGTAYFADGASEKVDNVIFCTGFRPYLSFLPKEVLQQLEYDPDDSLQPLILGHQTWRACVPDFAFVGVYRGPYFGVMELQARWVTRMWGGLVSPPSATANEAALKESRSMRTKHPRPQFPTDYVDIMEELAIMAGLIPSLPCSLQAAPPTSEVQQNVSLGQGSSNDPGSSRDVDGVSLSPRQRVSRGDQRQDRNAAHGSDELLTKDMDQVVEWMWSGPLLPCHYIIRQHLTNNFLSADTGVAGVLHDHVEGPDDLRAMVGLRSALAELRSVNTKY